MNHNLIIETIKLVKRRNSKYDVLTDFTFSGWIGKYNWHEGELKDEFHVNGKYFGFYGEIEPDIEEKYYIESAKTLCFMDETYKGFHHHFIVPWYIGIDRFEIIKNKVYFDSKLFTEKELDWCNSEITNIIINGNMCEYVFEEYGITNNIIRLKL
jgi:hypothetical protein